MDRRTFVKGSAAVVGASTLPAGRVYAQAAAAPDKIRFGYAITQSGPLGPGAESTTVSQYKLWQKRVNDAGGIMLKKFNKKVPIDLVSYDDQGKPDELPHGLPSASLAARRCRRSLVRLEVQRDGARPPAGPLSRPDCVSYMRIMPLWL